MKKRLITAAVIGCIIGALIMLIRLIGSDGGPNIYIGDLYFFNETGTAIEAETREIHYKNDKTLAEAVIEALMKGPEESRHQRIIERKTKILSIDDEESGNALVNFTREFITGDGKKDILAVYAVVKSLCATQEIHSVKIIIEGKDIAASDGSIIGYLTDEDINLSTDTYNSETREITLYFPPKLNNKTLKSEVRRIKVTDQQPLAQYIINELINGPGDEELGEVLSKDTVLLSVDTYNNICFVNFKSNFLDKNSGSADKEKITILSIVNSLTELEAIDRVQFLMDGKKVTNFGNINIYGMFGRDESVIE